MWTHTIVTKERTDGGKYHVGVEFTNGDAALRMDYNVESFEDLRRLVTAELAKQEALDLSFAKVATGEAIDVTPPEPPAVDPAVLEQAKYLRLEALAKRFAENNAAGVYKGVDAQLVADTKAGLDAAIGTGLKSGYYDPSSVGIL